MGGPDRSTLAALLHAALPQTQCTRCGYPDCAGYAEAMAAGEAPVNQCPPGGAEGVARLARITGQPAAPLNPQHGTEGPRMLAVIDEAWCIGCTLCLNACPTDAILGGHKRMHTVIEPYCTGCELCLPACPVDCISLVNASGTRTGWSAWSQGQAGQALARYDGHRARMAQDDHEHAVAQQARAEVTSADLPAPTQGADSAEAERRKAVVAAALEKARARRAAGS